MAADIEADADRQVQHGWIAILQDGRWPIGQRLQRLGCAAHALHRDESTTPLRQMETALEAFEPVRREASLEAFALQTEMLRGIADQSENISDEYIALCALYACLRILTVGYMMKRSAMNGFVDVCAAAFKLFDHSNFDHNAMVVVHRKGLDNEEVVRCCMNKISG